MFFRKTRIKKDFSQKAQKVANFDKLSMHHSKFKSRQRWG